MLLIVVLLFWLLCEESHMIGFKWDRLVMSNCIEKSSNEIEASLVAKLKEVING